MYRYSYFAYLLSNNNRFAKQAVNAPVEGIGRLLSHKKDDYPHCVDDAMEAMMRVSKRIKYRTRDVGEYLWRILGSDFGYRTKMTCIQKAIATDFFEGKEAEKLTAYCKNLYPHTKGGWQRECCEAGLFFAANLQKGATLVFLCILRLTTFRIKNE